MKVEYPGIYYCSNERPHQCEQNIYGDQNVEGLFFCCTKSSRLDRTCWIDENMGLGVIWKIHGQFLPMGPKVHNLHLGRKCGWRRFQATPVEMAQTRFFPSLSSWKARNPASRNILQGTQQRKSQHKTQIGENKSIKRWNPRGIGSCFNNPECLNDTPQTDKDYFCLTRTISLHFAKSLFFVSNFSFPRTPTVLVRFWINWHLLCCLMKLRNQINEIRTIGSLWCSRHCDHCLECESSRMQNFIRISNNV